MTWVIDPAHTFIEFSAKHMMFTTVRGRFHKFHGTVTLDEANPLHSSAEGVVETDSLDTKEPYRDAHLRSPDFFDVIRFPTMTFRTDRIEPMGQNVYNIAGILTIKDVTREIVFEVVAVNLGKDPDGIYRWGFSAQAELNRKDFGLTWNAALETGGWLVGDQIKITAELQLMKQTEAVPDFAELPGEQLLAVV